MGDSPNVNLADWPEPEARARPALPADMPGACRTFVAKAQAAGWEVRATYARGTAPAALNRWEPGAVVDSVLVKCWRGGVGVVAKWEDGRTKGAWLVIRSDWPYPLSVTQAKAVLES